MAEDSIYVVILNYNNWKDTIACAESVLASTVSAASIIIVDNASTDDSLEMLYAWCDGLLEDSLAEFGVEKSTPKPLGYSKKVSSSDVEKAPLVIIENTNNGGYAAGNNLGIVLAMQWGASAVWILNNDTMVEKDALRAMRDSLFSKARPGLCGSLIRYVDTGLVQCCGGGHTVPWTGLSCLFGHKLTLEEAIKFSAHEVEQRINFIYGASVMASREFIETVGLMDERYFLYCEEQDWAYSAKDRFDLAYTPEAVVHHKEGSSTGFSGKKMTLRSLWYLTRSRVLLTWKHKKWCLPTVLLSIGFAGMRMIWRRVLSVALQK